MNDFDKQRYFLKNVKAFITALHDSGLRYEMLSTGRFNRIPLYRYIGFFLNNSKRIRKQFGVYQVKREAYQILVEQLAQDTELLKIVKKVSDSQIVKLKKSKLRQLPLSPTDIDLIETGIMQVKKLDKLRQLREAKKEKEEKEKKDKEEKEKEASSERQQAQGESTASPQNYEDQANQVSDSISDIDDREEYEVVDLDAEETDTQSIEKAPERLIMVQLADGRWVWEEDQRFFSEHDIPEEYNQTEVIKPSDQRSFVVISPTTPISFSESELTTLVSATSTNLAIPDITSGGVNVKKPQIQDLVPTKAVILSPTMRFRSEGGSTPQNQFSPGEYDSETVPYSSPDSSFESGQGSSRLPLPRGLLNRRSQTLPALPSPSGSIGFSGLASSSKPNRLAALGRNKLYIYLILLFAAFALPMFLGLNDSNPPFIKEVVDPWPNLQIKQELPTDISVCKFARSDQGDSSSVSFSSPLLMSYFQEASLLSGVPASVLAGIARIESTSSVDFTDEQVANYQCNEFNTSVTGARGLMQLQPPGTTGYYQAGIEAGASLLGKPASQIDFCNVRENIIVSAGFIITKTHALLGDGGSGWDPSWTDNQEVINEVARGYYGCLNYPSCVSGPHSYGDDLWTSVQSCKTFTVPPQGPLPPGSFTGSICPIPNGNIICSSQYDSSYQGCHHCGVGYPAESQTAFCGYPGTRYAIDIGAPKGASVYLPTIAGNPINWTYLSEEVGTSGEAIEKYSGENVFTKEQFFLQLHHSAVGSGNPGTHQSGEVGARVCSFSDCDHTHVQIASGGVFPTQISGSQWLDASAYLCK